VTARDGALLGAAVVIAGVSVLGLPGIAAAGATPTGSAAAASTAVPAPPAGTRTLCQVSDPRLPEISGLVVVGQRMLVMNDGGDRLVVYVLDKTCRVVAVHTAAVDPYDPEDLAVGADGTVWFSDTGDNLDQRSTVALLALHPDGSTAIYRLTYPDGPHDAEALLLTPSGQLFIATKEPLDSNVYTPTGPLSATRPTPLRRVASTGFLPTGTAEPCRWRRWRGCA
jgi:sugar lactone lactonase YvrE